MAGRRLGDSNDDIVSFKLSGLSPSAREALLAAPNRSEYIRQALEVRVNGLGEALAALGRIEAAVAELHGRVAHLERLVASGVFSHGSSGSSDARQQVPARQLDALVRWALEDDAGEGRC